MNAQPNSPEHLEDTVGLKETKLRHTLDTIPAMVWIASPEGEAMFVNRGWTEYFGLSLLDVRGRGWARTVHPDDVEPFVAKWRASLATGQPLEEEVRFRRGDGEYRWFLIRGVPAREEGGKIANWYSLGTDITERKQAEEASRRAEKESRTIVAEGDFVILHGRFSDFGLPVNWIVADIVQMKDGILVEHWDVIQDEATRESSKSGLPMFGDKFGVKR